MTLDELGLKIREIEEAREAVDRELVAAEHRSQRIAEFEAMRDVWSRREELWETLDDMHEWTKVPTPGETADKYRARLAGGGALRTTP